MQMAMPLSFFVPFQLSLSFFLFSVSKRKFMKIGKDNFFISLLSSGLHEIFSKRDFSPLQQRALDVEMVLLTRHDDFLKNFHQIFHPFSLHKTEFHDAK